jgi:hypothetical protein
MREDCYKLINDYKEHCKVVYSNITCHVDNEHKIHKMSLQELNQYLKTFLPLHKKSQECYKLRKIYKSLCVAVEKRDSGHDYAIEKAIHYNKLCENLIVKIKNRILKLNGLLLENIKLLEKLS